MQYQNSKFQMPPIKIKSEQSVQIKQYFSTNKNKETRHQKALFLETLE